MVAINAYAVSPTPIRPEFFGGNILSSRDSLDEGNTFETVAEQLGITAFRYPGGSLTENYFDIANPDKISAPNVNGQGDVDLIPFSQYMTFIEENEYSTTIVIPTRNLLGEDTDENGNRLVDFDEAELRGFISDTLSGRYGQAKIDAFEIGNEYWGSGHMNSIEYGRLASRVAQILDDELANHDLFEEKYLDTKVLVQMGADNAFADFSMRYSQYGTGEEQLARFNADHGQSFGDEYLYSSGQVKWGHIANELIISEFHSADSISSIDGLIAHVYSRGPDTPQSRYFSLRTVEQTWGNHLENVEVSVTEWNQSAATEALEHHTDFGLAQAHEMLNILEGFTQFDVTAAHVWPLQQNTANDLSGDVGQSELTAPGAMFSMMSETLAGTTPVSLNNERHNIEHELQTEDFDVHAFYADDRMVFFIASNDLEGCETHLDFSQMFTDQQDISINLLTVADGQNPASTSSTAELLELDPAHIYETGVLDLQLEGLEIMMIEVHNPTYTSRLLNLMEPETEPTGDPLIIPEVPIEDDDDTLIGDEDSEEGYIITEGMLSLDNGWELEIGWELGGFMALMLAVAGSFG